jgi:hypothetical protein
MEPALKALGGIVTGYSTNDTAIKMLFRKYGPFGGVIIETRDEFIMNTSELVERDIINHNTIVNELEKEGFKSEFQKIVSDILGEYLYENTDDIDLIDIPEMDETFDNLMNFYGDNSEDFISGFLDILLPNVAIKDIIGDKQLNILANNLADESIEVLADNEVIEDLVEGLYSKNKDKKVAEFISQKIFKTVADNLRKKTYGFHDQLEINFDHKIDEMIDILYDKLNISNILVELETSIKARSLAEVLGKENSEDISNELLKRLIRFIKSEDGKELLFNFLENILKLLKKVDLSVLSLFDKYFGDNLRKFMVKELPNLIKRLIDWIKDNKDEMENLVDEAIQEALGQGSGIKNKIKDILYDLVYNGDFAKKNDILTKLIEGIQNEVDTDELSEELSDEIIKFSEKNSIGDIIRILEDKEIIKIEELVLFIEDNIDNLIAELNLTSFDELFRTKVGDMVDINFKEFFEENIREILLKKLKQEFLFNRRLTRSLQREITDQIMELGQYRLVDIISTELLEDNMESIKVKSLDELESRKGYIVDKLSNTINELIKDKKLTYFIESKVKEEVIKNASERSFAYLSEVQDELGAREVKSFYDRLNQKEDIEEMLKLLNKQNYDKK